jgi:hypothetical protein
MLKRRVRRLESLVKRCGLDSGVPPQSSPRRLQTVQDLFDLLEEQVEAIRTQPWAGTLEKARAIAHLAGIARKAIEAGVVSARLEMLEKVLKNRKGERE